LICLTAAYAADNINVTPESFSFHGNVSQVFSGVIYVKNLGNSTVNVSVYKTSGLSQFPISGLSNILNLAPNSTQTRSFTLTIPSNQAPGTYNGQICANVTTSGVYDCSDITVIVDPKLSMTVSPLSMVGYQNESLAGTFTITNNGNSDLNNLVISPITNMDAFGLTYSENNIYLTAGQSKTITVRGTIPYERTGVVHGYFNVSNDQINVASNATLTILSRLVISNLNVKVGKNSDDFSNGNVIDYDDSAYPGAPLQIKVDLENDAGEKLTNIKLNAIIEGIDDGDDMKSETYEINSLSDGSEKKNLLISFPNFNNSIPWKVDEGTYNLIINATGKGEDSKFKYTTTWQLKLKVYRDSDPNLKLTEVSLVPTDAQCGDQVKINVQARNIGDENSNFAIELKSQALGFSKKFSFALSNNYDDDLCTFSEADDNCIGIDDSYSFILPSNAKGNYTIDVIALAGTKQTDKKTLLLNVTCEGAAVVPSNKNTEPQNNTQPNNNSVVVINPNPISQYTTLPVRIVETSSRPLFDKNSKEYPYIIAGGIFVILAVIIGLIVVLTKK